MKTGEEKFDDEIRQKLRYSEVKPPIDLFDTIVPPPKNKKRGFFWVWLAGVVILGLTTIGVHYFSGNNGKIANEKRNQTFIKQSERTLNPEPGPSTPEKVRSSEQINSNTQPPVSVKTDKQENVGNQESLNKETTNIGQEKSLPGNNQKNSTGNSDENLTTSGNENQGLTASGEPSSTTRNHLVQRIKTKP